VIRDTQTSELVTQLTFENLLLTGAWTAVPFVLIWLATLCWSERLTAAALKWLCLQQGASYTALYGSSLSQSIWINLPVPFLAGTRSLMWSSACCTGWMRCAHDEARCLYGGSSSAPEHGSTFYTLENLRFLQACLKEATQCIFH